MHELEYKSDVSLQFTRSVSLSESASSNIATAMAYCVKCVLPFCLFVVILTVASSKTPARDEPFDCPLNEVYHKCDDEVCYKTCEHLRRHPACPSVDPKCFKPTCLCEGDTLRNSAGLCVPIDQCPQGPPVDDQPAPEELALE